MSWNPIGIDGDRASGYRTDYPSVRRTVVPNRLIDGVNVNTGPSSGRLTLDEAREQIRAALDSFRSAFGAFTSGTKGLSSTSISTNPASTATLGGLSARVNSVSNIFSTLQTTSAINPQTSTDRSSSAAIGLDLTTGISSQLSSAALGLDITSPQAASTLKSSAALALDLTSRQSTVASTGEMNSAATEYGSPTLNFANGTSVGTLSGTYTGVNTAANATSLTIDLNRDSTFTLFLATRVQFDVKDQTGATLFTFDGNIAAGQAVYLGADIGLSVTFSNGTLKQNDTASTTVAHNPAVDANAAFNNANPYLRPRFDGGAQVTAGSFSINGTTIAVNANDTVNTVISRINSSAAGVTAAVANDRITLTSNSASEADIVLANDTSGFLGATKLAGATTTRGNIADDQQALSGTPQFGAVTSGSFTVNGVSISINKDTDSLDSVITKINSSGAGVTASLDSAQNKVVLTTNANSEDQITVGGDTTGFLAASGLSTGNTVRGNIRDDQQVLSKTTQFASVASGSFTVNGVSISVNKDTDSLSSIVSRINGAGAGVTASFNASTNKIDLATTSASEDLITVGNDTTGFLAATGLNSASTVRGKIADNTQALSATAAFAGVATGSFTINGVSISVDPGQDSLDTLITRINNSGAGVTASYNTGTDQLTFAPNVAGATLAIENDTSGFLTAAKIASGVTGTDFDADAAFNGTGLNAALFEPGATVQAGSFTVNGTTTNVAANDTVNTVLARITASGAGVTATYDDATETVRLTRTVASADPITVGNDTSGFLAAVKLNTAQSTTGAQSTSPFDATLSSMVEYAGVQTGTVTVNGQQIAVDPTTTTIRGLVSSLNSVPDLVATLDDTTGAVRVSSTTSNGTITISDTSGVLSKLGILSGTYNSSFGGTTVVETQRTSGTVGNTAEVVKNVATAVDQLNAALSQIGAGDDALLFRDEVTATIEDAVDALRDAGIEGFTASTDDLADVQLSVDRDTLTRALHKIGEHSFARTAIGEALDGFSDHMARIGAAPGSDPSQNGRPLFGNGNPAFARLTADQAVTALLYLRSSLQPLKADASAAKAAEAYAKTKDVLDQSDRASRFNLTDQIQDHLAAAQVPLSFPQAAPPPVHPSRPGVAKTAKVDSGHRGLGERDRPASPSSSVSENTARRRSRDEDTFEYRGSDKHAAGIRTRRGARRALRGALRSITGRNR